MRLEDAEKQVVFNFGLWEKRELFATEFIFIAWGMNAMMVG